MSPQVRRVGHKGADAITKGNTLESFGAAVEAGVDMIEFDVLRPRTDFPEGADWRKAGGGAAEGSGPLLIAHDWADAAAREPMVLADALEAFTRAPLDRVEIDLDLKVAGREDEVVAALGDHGLLERAMTSTMEIGSVVELGKLEPSLRRGWTLPRVTRDWTRIPWAKPLVGAGMLTLRSRLPAMIERRAPELGVVSMWIYHPLITKAIADATHNAGCELVAWTVDDRPRMDELVALGVDAICTNDPRLFTAEA